MTTASGSVWRPRTAAKCWRAAGPKVGKDSPSALAARNRLPRTLTLKRRADISSLLKEGRRLHGSICTLVWEPAESFKYGIFLSGKSGPAHDRNRVKRYFREAVRLSRGELAVYAAFLPRSRAMESSCELVKSDVNRLFDQIRQH